MDRAPWSTAPIAAAWLPSRRRRRRHSLIEDDPDQLVHPGLARPQAATVPKCRAGTWRRDHDCIGEVNEGAWERSSISLVAGTIDVYETPSY